MQDKEMENVLDFYYDVTALKNKIRQGWIYWNVSNTRVESIAEHIFGAQMIAVAIYSQLNLQLDIFKVLSMLSLHETEEVIIGDYTPIDNVSEEEKLRQGNEAVDKILGSRFPYSKIFVELIDEFNEKKTPEAQFAFLCDKYDCILQLKKYSDEEKCTVINATIKVLSSQEVKKIIDNGVNTVLDIFMQEDRYMYTGTIIEELFEFTQKYRIKS